MARMGYGFVCMVCILGIWAIAYIATNPAMAALYAAGQQLTPDVLGSLDFIRTVWQVLPLGVILGVVIWGVLAGMGTATSPWRVILGWLVLLMVLLIMMAGYVGLDSLFETIYLAITNPTFQPAADFIRMVWHAYPIPLTIGLLLWALVQSIASEANEIYG